MSAFGWGSWSDGGYPAGVRQRDIDALCGDEDEDEKRDRAERIADEKADRAFDEYQDRKRERGGR